MPARRKGVGSMMNAGFLPALGLQPGKGGNPRHRRERDEGEGEDRRDGGGKGLFALGDRKERS